ncbi:MAG: arsenate reductase ArsC [Gammaproteobacteria bacterium]|nr:arsenate reductase ArsC [Gammaproteobacteria bacterium]
MAEGLLRHFNAAGFKAYSAGIKRTSVNPLAIEVMQELGIDISSQRSKSIDEFSGTNMDYVVTVCDHAQEVCPVFPARIAKVHTGFEDPGMATGSRNEKLEAFRRVRDEIKAFIEARFAS